MSQIAAIFANVPIDARCFKSMIRSLEDRPHDASGSWTFDRQAVAACTLHTTEESLDADQPHVTEDQRVALVLDGYLTNYEELRRDLIERGVTLRNRSDGELALRAYEQWGQDCARHLDGEFAIIVADDRNHLMFCARDHQGLRPLYYTADNGVFMAASNVAALLSGMKTRPAPDFEFLAELSIAQFASIEHTAWKGIYRLPIASTLTLSDGKQNISKYYTLQTSEVRDLRSDEEYVEAYLNMLSDVVRRASRALGPLAFDVSGGLDSSALYCLAHRLADRGELQAGSIRGYTLTGEPGSRADEVEFARAAARHVHGDLTEVPLFLPPLDWFAQLTSRESDIATFPNASHSIGAEKQMVRDGAKVTIGGNGGDQWLDGSSAHLEQNLRAARFGRYWDGIRSEVGAQGLRKALPSAVRQTILAALPDGFRAHLRQLRNDLTSAYGPSHDYVPEQIAASIRARMKQRDAQMPGNPVAFGKQSTFLSTWTQFANDLMSRQWAASGIEGRSPMLSRQFIEFCSALPEDLKRRDGLGRWVHRRALENVLPAQIVHRRTKAAFFACLEAEHVIALILADWPKAMDQAVDKQALSAVLDANTDGSRRAEMLFELWGIFMVRQFLLDIAAQQR